MGDYNASAITEQLKTLAAINFVPIGSDACVGSYAWCPNGYCRPVNLPPAPPATLFFSEYAEGTGNNKFLEIFNPTSQSIPLDWYAFPSTTNAPNTPGRHESWNVFTPGKILEPGGVYIICHPSANADILALCNQTHYALSDGDDGFCIAEGNQGNHIFIDCVGDFNGDPGVGWNVCGVEAATADNTLVRKPEVNTGNAGDWSMSAGTNANDCEWSVLPSNTWAFLGSHQVVAAASSSGMWTSSVGEIVSARGYVTAMTSSGFYMQQSASGSLWGGIFVSFSAGVADPNLDTRAVGDYVEVVAVIAE